ncbi:uncharacterized protein A4U43_C05F24240 [Asparagus officinalis]|uniref:Protein ENHANCED DISEASE RESISTANCE 2 C-terminal domain-containing protein n=1 Tax=Asparagus officinalis TaxID=4686 RepID=A0A5P1EU26_ASPOF|nr:uncharacterized protein A4U43_C05F24240 [Asparagus officinalis]
MAYVDHAFSISDEDFMMEPSYVIQNRPPIKEVALAVALLVFGTLAIVFGSYMAANRIGGDRAHGTKTLFTPKTLIKFLDWCNFDAIFAKIRGLVCDSGLVAVLAGVLLYEDRVLCVQGLQRLLLLKHTAGVGAAILHMIESMIPKGHLSWPNEDHCDRLDPIADVPHDPLPDRVPTRIRSTDPNTKQAAIQLYSRPSTADPPPRGPPQRIQRLGPLHPATSSTSAPKATSPAPQKTPSGRTSSNPPASTGSAPHPACDNVLGRPDNRIRRAQAEAQTLKSFIFAVNLQIPGRDCHSAVFYFAADEPISPGSLLYRFVNGDDAFRNSRFKIVNRIVKGPWIVKAAVGNCGLFAGEGADVPLPQRGELPGDRRRHWELGDSGTRCCIWLLEELLVEEPFLLEIVRIPGEQLLLTASLRYITSTFESVELNTVPVLVFVVPVLAGREKFRFWSLNGQAKLLGVLSSAVGATVLVIFEDGKGSNVKSAQGPKGRLTGCFLLGLAALVASAAYLFLGTVIAAMVNFARIWCIHKKGPVLVLAFTPLLIVYSFLFQTLVFQVSPRFWSIVAASFVIGGLYILLWAKSRDSGARKVDNGDEQNRLSESSTAEPLLGNI